MSTNTDYVTEQDFLDYIGSKADTGNPVIQNAITAASRGVDAYCTRSFYERTATLYYSPDPTRDDAAWCLPIDDLSTTTSLAVHTDGSHDGTYSTALTINTDFAVEPVNRQFGGVTGWPYTELRATSNWLFPRRLYGYQPHTVKVAGTFGWPAFPAGVVQATKIVAAMYYELAKAPFGVAGWGAYGDIRVRDIPQATTLLQPYRKASGFGIG